MTNEEVQTSVERYWERLAKQHDMTVDEYREYRKMKNEERRKEWGLSMSKALTEDDAQLLAAYTESLNAIAKVLVNCMSHSSFDPMRGALICEFHDSWRLVTAMLDRIEENRD